MGNHVEGTAADLRLRQAVRAIVIAMRSGVPHVLLVHLRHEPTDWIGWILPGGGIEAGESPTQALERELREEVGVPPSGRWQLGEVVTVRERIGPGLIVGFDGQSETIIEVPSDYFEVDPALSPDELRSEGIQGHRWWPVDSLASTSETVVAPGLRTVLERRGLQSGTHAAPTTEASEWTVKELAAKLRASVQVRSQRRDDFGPLIAAAYASGHRELEIAASVCEASLLVVDLKSAEALVLLRRAKQQLDEFEALEFPYFRWRLHFILGDALDEVGDFTAAEKELQRAAELADFYGFDTEWEWTAVNLVFVQRQIGDAEAIVRTVTEAIHREPGVEPLPSLRLVISDLFLWLEIPQVAIMHREANLAQGQPANCADLRELARAYAMLGDYSKSTELLRQADQLIASTTVNRDEIYRTLLEKAAVSLEVGDSELCRSQATEALALVPSELRQSRGVEALLLLARVEGPEAGPGSAFQMLLEVDPDLLGMTSRQDFHRLMADVHEGAGDLEAAVGHMAELNRLVARSTASASTLLQINMDLVDQRVAPWRENESEQVTVLSEALVVRDTVTIMAGKELRGPLASMRMATDLLRGGHGVSEVMPLLRASLSDLKLTTRQLAAIDLLDQADATFLLREMPVDELIQTSIELIEPVATSREIVIVCDEVEASSALSCVVDESVGVTCLATILRSALRAAPDGSTISIGIHQVLDDVEFRISVPLRSVEAADDMRQAFRRLLTSSLLGSEPTAGGLGLSMSRALLHRLGGNAAMRRTSDDHVIEMIGAVPLVSASAKADEPPAG